MALPLLPNKSYCTLNTQPYCTSPPGYRPTQCTVNFSDTVYPHTLFAQHSSSYARSQVRSKPMISSFSNARLLTFSPLISFKCSCRLRLTSRMRFPWSRITLILSASDRLSRRTKSSLVHLSSSSSVRPAMSSAGLSVFAMESWSWGWGGGVAFSIGAALPAPTKGRKYSEARRQPLPASAPRSRLGENGYRLEIGRIVWPFPLFHSLLQCNSWRCRLSATQQRRCSTHRVSLQHPRCRNWLCADDLLCELPSRWSIQNLRQMQ